MDTQTLRRARSVFELLVDLPKAEQVRRLAALEPEAELRRCVERLLEAADSETIEAALEREVARAQRDAGLGPAPGSRVGAYRLERRIGEGGMGEVFLARRDDGRFDARVAIKFLATSGTRAGLLFDRERRLLARMQDPGIVKLLDAGEDASGRQYLVMEYVEGTPVTDHARALRLEQRIELLRRAALAIDRAHRLLVVHRDLKPSHVLVDAQGAIRVLDFGVSTLLDPEVGTAPSGTTRSFTPRYAAPEQILGEPSTPAIDIYALGLLLHETLTGRHPFETDDAGAEGMSRRKLAGEMTALRRSSDLAGAPAVRLDPRRLRDLAAILQTALARHPADRYRTCADLAEDLGRFLAGRRVRARRESRREAVLRWVANHRWVSLSLAASLASLGIGLGAALMAAHEAARQRDLALGAAARAELLSQYVSDVFASAVPANVPGQTISAHELLARGAQALERRRAGMPPDTRSRLLLLLGRMLHDIGEFAEAGTQLRLAAEVAAEAGLSQVEREARVALGNSLVSAGEYDAALQVLEGFIQGEPPTVLDAPYVRACLRATYVHIQRGDESKARRVFELVARRSAEFAALGPESDELLGMLHTQASQFDSLRGDHRARVESNLASIAAFARRFGSERAPQIANAYADLGAAYAALGRWQASRDAGHRSLGIIESIYSPSHPSALIARMNYASNLLPHHVEEALQESRRVLDLLASLPDRPDYPWEGVAHFVHARALEDHADLAGAATHLRQAIDLVEQRLGTGNYRYGQYRASLGRVLGRSGDAAGAEAEFSAGIEALREAVGPGNPKLLEAELDRMVFVVASGDLERHRKLWPELHANSREVHGPDTVYMRLLRLFSPAREPWPEQDAQALAFYPPSSTIAYIIEVGRRYRASAPSAQDADVAH